MNSTDAISEYVIAHGPQDLREILDKHFERSQHDSEFAQQQHYILYQLGDQKSLIKVDMSKRPFQFWYHDLLGRPATRAVKEAIAVFLTDTVGETDIIIKKEGSGDV